MVHIDIFYRIISINTRREIIWDGEVMNLK